MAFVLSKVFGRDEDIVEVYKDKAVEKITEDVIYI